MGGIFLCKVTNLVRFYSPPPLFQKCVCKHPEKSQRCHYDLQKGRLISGFPKCLSDSDRTQSACFICSNLLWLFGGGLESTGKHRVGWVTATTAFFCIFFIWPINCAMKELTQNIDLGMSAVKPVVQL